MGMREKLIEILRKPIFPHELVDPTEAVADYLLDSGVTIPVRCKDCKYQIKEWHPDNRMISKGYYTYGCDRNFHRYSSNAVNGMDNDFCSYGERKNDG